METYRDLVQNPPSLQVKNEAKEVVFTTISSMCDNRHILKMKKNSEGDFKLNGCGFHLSNFGFKFDTHEIEWEADAGEWGSVILMINSGYQRVSKLISR